MSREEKPFEVSYTIYAKGRTRGGFMEQAIEETLESYVKSLNTRYKGLTIKLRKHENL